VLEFELDTMLTDTMWLEAEVATLVPLQPDVTFARKSIRERPDLGKAHNDFYDTHYLETRDKGKSVGRYRKMLGQAEPPVEVQTRAACEHIHIAGPDLDTIETFPKMVGPEGELSVEVSRRLQYVVVRSIMPLEFDFDGMQFHLLDDEAETRVEELLVIWRELYGEEHLPSVDWWCEALSRHGPDGLGQPVLTLKTHCLTETPPGWSIIADAFHYPGLAGQRGIIATDVFYASGVCVFVAHGPGEFRIPAGAPLARILPVPRHLLSAEYRVLGLDGELLR
jgi:hypothetical protein